MNEGQVAEWRLSTISKHARITTESKDTQNKVENGKHPFFVRSQKVERIDSYAFDGEGVLTAGDGVGTGKVFHYICGKFDYHQRVYLVSDFDKNLDGKFFYYYFSENFFKQVQKLSAKGSVDSVRMEMISEMPLPLSPLPEQQKIAAILSSVDGVIEKTRAQIDKLKDLKTGIMQELLTKGIGSGGVPHTEFKDSPVGRIPHSWECELVGNLFQIQLGKMLSQAAKVGTAPLPYLGNKNVQWGKVDTSDLEIMDFSDRERKKFSLKVGDLLMCEGGEVGRSAIWEGEIGTCYYQKAIHRLRPVNASYEPRLLLEYVRYAKAQNLLTEFISQTSIAHLTKEKLAAIPVPVPPMQEQKRIVERLCSVDSQTYSLMSKLQKLYDLKKGLMQDLLTGKVRVNVDEKESVVA